jgi:hypothetical protein
MFTPSRSAVAYIRLPLHTILSNRLFVVNNQI